MRLKLTVNDLQGLVNRTIKEERAAEALKSEIGRVLGPVVQTDGRLLEVVAAANDRLDVLVRTGRSDSLEFDPTVTCRWATHVDPELRKFVARVCPEKYLPKFVNDNNPTVRAAVAGRLSLNAIREMIKRFPKDDQLRSIFRQKRLVEAGLPQSKVEPMGHDPVAGKERMGDLARTQPGPELSEAWYKHHAMKLMRDYGNNIEYAWEELAVKRFCSSSKATSGVEIDEARLLKNIKQLIKEKEDMVMERNPLRETLQWLENQSELEMLEEGIIPGDEDPIDPVVSLMSSNLTAEQFVSSMSQLFQIQEGLLPMGIRKYRLGEGNARQTMVPVIGRLPHGQGFRAVDERALDAFCEAWTRRQQLVGEPLRLEWTNHPTDMNKVGFTCVLK